MSSHPENVRQSWVEGAKPDGLIVGQESGPAVHHVGSGRTLRQIAFKNYGQIIFKMIADPYPCAFTSRMITSFIIRDISGQGAQIMEPTETQETQLPATITQAEITSSDAHTSLIVPALIADLGDDASWRYIEFFTANIRNPHTRRAYARACARFFGWCEDRGLALAGISRLQAVGNPLIRTAHLGRDERIELS